MALPNAAEVARLARTARFLGAVQVYHRLRLTARRRLWSRLGDRIDARYRRRAAALPRGRLDHAGLRRVAELRAGRRAPGEARRVADDALAGRFTFLNRTRELGPAIDWFRPDLDEGTRLWKPLLHEFPYALDLALAARGAEDDPRRRRFFELARSWRAASPIGRPGFALDAWNARAVSTRLVNWALAGSLLALDPEDPDARFLSEELAIHALFLLDNLEWDLKANHLLRDLVGLVFAQELFGCVPEALELLRRETREQVLEDGCHVERVPRYHAVVLEDLVETHALLGRAAPDWLGDTVARMAGFLAHLLPEDGRLPLFGDTYWGDVDACRLLEVAKQVVPRPAPRPASEASGLVVLRRGRTHAVIRAGPHGPDYQLGHAHADGLSFELCHGPTRIVTDTGTGTYDAGPVRARLRATAAHNTVQVGEAEQIEAWGSFRVGRRGRARAVARGGDADWDWIWARYAWDALRGSPCHERLLAVGADVVLVLDVVRGAEPHPVRSALHLHPDAPEDVVRVGALGAAVSRTSAPLHEEFNLARPMAELYVEAATRLPWTGGWVIAFDSADAELASELRQEEGTLSARCRIGGRELRARWRHGARGPGEAVELAFCPPSRASAT